MTDTKHPEATPQNLYQITGNVADMNTVLIERAELHRLQAENNGLRILASGGMELFERYSTFKAKCEELEAMLYAVGAGGVGQSIKPQIQADTAQEPGTGIPASVPTGWKLVPMEPTAAMLDAAFDTEVVHTERGVDAFVENTAEVYGAMLAAAPEAPAQQKPVAHLPCCGYTDTSALQWNPYNGVAQCHNCGQVYAAPPPPAPAQEPVAWRIHPFDYGVGSKGVYVLTTRTEQVEIWERKGWKVEPLYAAPQPPVQQEPVGAQFRFNDGQTVSDWKPCDIEHHNRVHSDRSLFFKYETRLIYTAPQPTRQPLTKARIDELYKECNKEVAKLDAEHRYIFGGWFPVAVRLIEKAHDITGSQQ